MKTPAGWKFKSRTVMSDDELKMNLTREDFVEIRAVAGDDHGHYEGLYGDHDHPTPRSALGGKQPFRVAGLRLLTSPEGVRGLAYLRNNGGRYEDLYQKTPAGWRIKEREYVPSCQVMGRLAPRFRGVENAPPARAAGPGRRLGVAAWAKWSIPRARAGPWLTSACPWLWLPLSRAGPGARGRLRRGLAARELGVVGRRRGAPLMGIFMLAVAANMALGRHPDCHCFGQFHGSRAGWSTLFRNGVLAAVAAFVVRAVPAQSGPDVLPTACTA